MASQQLSGALQQQLEQASWLLMAGVSDAGLIEAISSCGLATLLVLPDAHSLQQLEEEWERPWPEQLQVANVLLGEASGECPWFHYNDPRLNGPIPLEQLQTIHPNLKLERVELRQQITLADLLDRWEPAADDGGMVLLGHGASPEWLHAGLPGLRRSRSVGWQPRGHADTQTVHPWLEAAWLVPSPPHEPTGGWLLWERDETLRFQATVIAERDALAAERDVLLGERDALLAERAGLAAERDALATERDGLQAEHTALAAERDVLLGERDALLAERAGLAAERDALATERDGLQAEHTALAAERDVLLGERDGLQEQVRALEERMARINSELDEILALIDSANIEVATSEDAASTA